MTLKVLSDPRLTPWDRFVMYVLGNKFALFYTDVQFYE